MATKPSDLLNRLPSASELLEKPPIRALVSRWNRSAVAAGVRSFLDELRSDLERRAGEVQLPSLRELAERAARYVAQHQQPSLRPAINATGRFFGHPWTSLPLSDEALARLVAFGSSYVSRPDREISDVSKAACRLTGADAATVVGSYAGAVWLALTAIASGKQVLVARGEVSDLEAGCSLAAIIESARATCCEVGGVNRTSAADYESALAVETGAIVRNLADDYRVVGECETVELESLVALARDHELPLIELLGSAPLVSNLPLLESSIHSAAASLAEGAPMVIVRGNGLVGGPACGLVLGSRSLVDRIESHPMFAACRAKPAALAALDATLMHYDDPQQLQQAVPLFRLLATSVENLSQRAERLAPQLAQASDVEQAVAVATTACLGLARFDQFVLPSCAIALRPTNGDTEALDRRLQSASTPIFARRENDQLFVDLRTVLPRDDGRLVEQIAGPLPTMPSVETAITNEI